METKKDLTFELTVYNRVIKIIWTLIVIVGVVVLLGLILSFYGYSFGKLSTEKLHFEFTAPGLKMNVNSGFFDGFLIPVLLCMGVNVFMTIVLLLYNLSQFKGIFSSFRDNNTPFTKENVGRMKKMSCSFFIYSVLIFTASMILKLVLSKNMPVGNINSIQIQFDTSLPVWPLMFGFLVFGIAKIFDYGIRLQQDNDSIV